MGTSETSGRRDISGPVRGIRGRFGKPWKVWITVSFILLLIALAWPVLEALFFYGSAFFETSVAIVYLVIIVVVSVVLFAMGAYFWRREQLKEYEPPIIQGFELLELPEHIHLVEKLFMGFQVVTLKKRFRGGHKNAGVFLVGRPPPLVDCVLKFARSKDINEELERQQLIQGHLGNLGGAYVDHRASLDEDVAGAIVYTLAGLSRAENLLNFSEFYRQIQDLNDITGIVRRLYTQVLPHCRRKIPSQLLLFQEYNRLTRKRRDITDAVQGHRDLDHVRLTSDQVEVSLPGVRNVTLKNPLHWVATTFLANQQAGTRKDVYEGIIHGDFHSGNILVETLEAGGRNIWIIDFADTRRGHTLDDFCRLEADIKFCLTGVSEDTHREKVEDFFRQAYEFERSLLSPTSVGQLDLNAFANPARDPQFIKAWECIKVIRNEAVRHLMGFSLYPYYLSLLHSTLPVMYYGRQQCNRWQKLYAFISAAILCEKMDQIQDP
jgi:hypothetical protein